MVRDNVIDGMRLFEDVTFADSHGQTFHALADGSYILQEGGRATLYGEGWVIRDGVMRKLQEDGESCPL